MRGRNTPGLRTGGFHVVSGRGTGQARRISMRQIVRRLIRRLNESVLPVPRTVSTASSCVREGSSTQRVAS